MYSALILLFLFSLLVPLTSLAQGLIPCSGPDCSICDLLVLINNIYLFVITWSPIVAVLRIGYAGILMIINGSNSSKVGEARKSIQNTLFWLVIIYCSFLVVNLVIHLLPVKEELKGSWYKFTCESKDPSLGGTGLSKVTGGRVSLSRAQERQENNGQETPINVGNYTPPKSGWCSRESFQKYAPQWVKDETTFKIASCVCAEESAGSPTVSNTTNANAICQNRGNPKSVVWGLFQIDFLSQSIRDKSGVNLLCYKNFGPYTLQEFDAVPSRWSQCYIKDMGLYNKCVAAATDPYLNMQRAVELSQSSRAWEHWSSAKARMGEYGGKKGECSDLIYSLTGKRY